MDSPFFSNRRWYQQPDPIRNTSFHPASVRGVPVYPVDPIHETHRPTHVVHRPQERSSGQKVVRIPVQFIGSEPVDRAGSAEKIQKVFRGFFVRKCLKKVEDVRVQVDEIEEKISRSEVVELLRTDGREKLRMNEALMSLLLKLDSICGVDFGVRGCRKAVIRKVIALQERIDAIVAADLERNCEIDDDVTEIGVSVDTENPIKPDHPSGLGDCVECGENLDNVCSGQGNDDNHDGETEIIDVGVDWEMKASESSGDNLDLKNDCEVNVEKQGNGLDDNRRNRELLEKMMEDSEKMTKLMSDLYERNEMQTKMLNALTQRVEMLEKAFLCDRLRKKKKNNKSKTSTTCKEN